jgi:hypothetical protein
MNRFKKKLKSLENTLKYALPFAATAFFAQELKGQMLLPSGVINPFISPDNTEAATTYNNLNSKTKAERDALADAIIKASRVHTIPSAPGVVWNCQDWTMLEIVNSYNWGRDIYNDIFLLYNNYDGFELDKIYANGGTFADQGKNGLPMMIAIFDIPLYNAAHAFCTLLTGNNALNGNDWNDIEPRDGITNVQPGELNVPLNTDIFSIIYVYIFKNSVHEKNLGGMRILEFKIVNGEKILTYNINDNPSFNTRMRLITQRESDPPTIDIKQGTDPDSLICTLKDENLKSAWYTVDNGEKIPLMTEVVQQVTEKKVAIKMNLPNGTHQIKIGVDDYFRYVTEKTEQRTITINNPPVITITSPTEGTIYDKDVELQYNITDEDFATAWYSLDNGKTKISVGKSGTIQLQLSDGIQKLLMEATDKKPQTTSKTVNFEINRPPTINITTPEEGKVYDKNISLIYTITDKDFATAWYSLDNGKTKIPIGQNGTIPLQLTNGLYTLLLQATDKRPQETTKNVNFEMKKTTGIDNPTITEKIKIYPIPVKDQLNIEYKFDTEQKIHRELYDINGRLIYNDKIEIAGEQTDRIDMSKYARGMYILEQEIGSETKTIKLTNIIKR